jgi:hypothetical protein
MSTHGTVRIYEGDEEIARFHRHADGYPDGLGRELADFCDSKRIVNGISSRHRANTIANGASCLAAQLIAFFKDGPGGVYVDSIKQDCVSGYQYRVKCPLSASPGDDGLPVTVEAYDYAGNRVEIPDAR